MTWCQATETVPKTHRQHPVDGDPQRLPDAEQVHEAPHERGDEGRDRHEHEPRRVVGGR